MVIHDLVKSKVKYALGPILSSRRSITAKGIQNLFDEILTIHYTIVIEFPIDGGKFAILFNFKR